MHRTAKTHRGQDTSQVSRAIDPVDAFML